MFLFFFTKLYIICDNDDDADDDGDGDGDDDDDGDDDGGDDDAHCTEKNNDDNAQ